METETVRVVSPVTDENPQGFIIINKSDLTEEHQVFGEHEVAQVVERKRAKKD